MAEKIVLRDLCKVFGKNIDRASSMLRSGSSKSEILAEAGCVIAVNNANLTIKEGEVCVIMGLSGSGKSTLIRLLNRLIEPTSGSILYDGVDIGRMSQKQLIEIRRRDMAMVFQSFALMPHLNVVDNVSFGLEMSGVTKEVRRQRAMQALDQVNLAEYASSYPDQLSGGMKQRVGLARALANDPAVMLMDEAFSALDPLIRTEMQDELLELQRTRKRTIVFISHDLSEAMRIGDKIVIMKDGNILQVGTPIEILRNPADEYVRSFFQGVDVSEVLMVKDIIEKVPTLALDSRKLSPGKDGAGDAELEAGYAYATDLDGKFVGIAFREDIGSSGGLLDWSDIQPLLKSVPVLSSESTISEIIGPVSRSEIPLPVVDAGGRFIGAISKMTILESLDKKGRPVT